MRIPIQRAFTITEIIVLVTVFSILIGISALSLGAWQHHLADNIVENDVRQAASGLQNYKNFRQNYPPNLAGTGYAASRNVALVLSTNAPSIGVYDVLTPDQNAQLFLNSCNANLFQTPNNTTCQFEGNQSGTKIHTKGTNGSNTIWDSPVTQENLTIDCGSNQSICDQAVSNMISQFVAQGGEFPIVVPEKNVPLPDPTQVPNGPADKFCLEGRATNYSDIIYHMISSEDTVVAGNCPDDPSLHYYQ